MDKVKEETDKLNNARLAQTSQVQAVENTLQPYKDKQDKTKLSSKLLEKLTKAQLVEHVFACHTAMIEGQSLANMFITYISEQQKQLQIAKKDIDDMKQVNQDVQLDLILKIVPEVVKAVMNDTQSTSKTLHQHDQPSLDKVEKHNLIIEPQNDEKFSQAQWSTVLKGTVKNKLSDVAVTKSSLTKSGKGLVSFPDRESRDQAADALKNDFHVSESDTTRKTLLPKMKICDLKDFKKEDCDKLKEQIPHKNPQIKALIDSGATLDVIYINEPTTEDLYGHAVIRVDPRIREKIIDNKRRLFIDTTSYYVKDQIHVTQCFACQAFGHKRGSSYCPLASQPNKNTCLYCSKDHKSSECTVKRDPSQHKCSNCASSKIRRIRDNSNHTSTSGTCPIHVKEINSIVKRTEVSDPKNYPIQRTIRQRTKMN